MLWRFSFATTSSLDNLLSRETPPTLEEVMDEQDVLAECKAQNNKLVAYLSKEQSIKSLLQWVVAGLDELDQQASEADLAALDHILEQPELYPSYKFRPSVPGPGPGSPPLEPAIQVTEQEAAGEATAEEVEKGDEGTAEEEKPEDVFPDVGLGEGLEALAPQTVDEEPQRSRYPLVATEILTSELWTIPESILQHKDELLRPFWDAVLPPIQSDLSGDAADADADADADGAEQRERERERDRARDEFWSDADEERDRKREIIRGMWVKVNGALITKRTTEMIRFIQTLPDIVERMLARISSPAVQDMLIRIVSAEEAGVPGVIEWLASEGLIPRLLALLTPFKPVSTHVIAAELLKSIITLCAPSPFNPHGGNAMEQQGQQPPGTRDNRLVRELVSERSISTLIGFMLDPIELNDDGADPFAMQPLPSVSSATSSLTHICSILTELIRRNNSDFSEPHLFHTLRNRLMSIRMQRPSQPQSEEDEEEDRKRMEEAMTEMSEKMGIVHLGTLLTCISARFDQLHRFLLEPRSQARAASVANPKPLTMERFRIVELYAELLHSSNMSILNRMPKSGPEYTADGILSGGLSGLEALGEAIDGDRVGEDATPEEQVTQARELPVSSGSTDASFTGSEDVASEDEKMLEDIDEESTPSASPAASGTLEPPPPSQADVARLRDVMEADVRSATSDVASASHAAAAADTTAAPSVASDLDFEPPMGQLPPLDDSLAPGDLLKQMYIQHRVLPTVVELFFEYPTNDFMHHVVYDMLQQVLNGRLGPGLNRELVIELIREAKLIERVLDAQRLNDEMSARTPRLAYMGHIILIAEELVKFLSRCPPELAAVIEDSWVPSEWEAFVDGTLRETKARDSQPLAGGKPMPVGVVEVEDAGNSSRSEDSSDDEDEPKFGEPLTRTVAQDGFADRGGFDEHDEEGNTVERYWRTVGAEASRRHVDSSDDDDDDADWLRPSLSASRGSDDEDEFGAFQVTRPGAARGGDGSGNRGDGDEFDDDAWGVFTSGSQDDAENPFGDDNFVPSVPPLESRSNPLTPHDWASEFDREFATNEPIWSAEDEGDGETPGAGAGTGDSTRPGAGGGPSIVVPSMDDEEETTPATPGSSWSFTGEDEGEDLPPTMSPTTGHVEVMKKDEAGLAEALESMEIDPEHEREQGSIPPSALASALEGERGGEREATSPSITPATSTSVPIPIRSPPTSNHDIHPLPSPIILGQAISPPDPSLIAAATEDAPLGPGVSPDTQVTPSGTLRKEVDGRMVEVPADEVALGVEEATRQESG